MTTQDTNNQHNQNPDYALRTSIGVLGLTLPFLIWAVYGELLCCMSHYYYTKSAIFFIGILFSFGMLLISYKGYGKDNDEGYFTDGVITNIGGFAALVTTIIPTQCEAELLGNGGRFCFPSYLFGHNDEIMNIIHVLSAGIFLLCMGWMSIFKFTRGDKNKEMNKAFKHNLYRICGYIIWACVCYLGIFRFGLKKKFLYDVYIFEAVCVVAFSISWLVKGRIVESFLKRLKA